MIFTLLQLFKIGCFCGVGWRGSKLLASSCEISETEALRVWSPPNFSLSQPPPFWLLGGNLDIVACIEEIAEGRRIIFSKRSENSCPDSRRDNGNVLFYLWPSYVVKCFAYGRVLFTSLLTLAVCRQVITHYLMPTGLVLSYNTMIGSHRPSKFNQLRME